ncbi:MAG TPA: hypothetical protein VHT73_04940 [Thermodesulfobacteriota bacterium]|nr:hypothetical protein [Thermodesulfobacteriota bacterium]
MEEKKNKKKQLILESKSEGSVTYQLKKIYCRNPRCKSCPHGPYWYAYYREGKKVVSEYIGKNFRKIEND